MIIFSEGRERHKFENGREREIERERERGGGREERGERSGDSNCFCSGKKHL